MRLFLADSAVLSTANDFRLDKGSKRSAERGLTNIEFRRAELENLPYADRTFDAVECVFGIFFVSNLAGGVRRTRDNRLESSRQSCCRSRSPKYGDTTAGTKAPTLCQLMPKETA